MATNLKSNDESPKGYTVFNYISGALVIAGISLFYTLQLSLWLKWGIVLLSVIAALGLFYFVSPTGLRLHSYVRDSWMELGKVVWPTRKETVQFTWIVFLLVVLLGLFLWLVDTSLSWLFYGVILGKGA